MHCVDLGESFRTDSYSKEYLLAKFGFDTAENESCKVCPLSAYRSPRCFVTPVEVGYYDPYIPELFWVNRFIDAVFWADLLLQFCIEVHSSQAGSPTGSIRLAFGFLNAEFCD